MKKGRDSHSQRLTRMEHVLERLLEIQEAAAKPAAVPPDQAAEATGFDEANLQTRIDAIVEDLE